MKKNEIVKVDEKALQELQDLYPVEQSNFTRISLPRLGFCSQDVTEGKGKNTKVVIEAGTFYEEKQTEEVDEEGKKIWEKKEIGAEIEAIILYNRYQLSYYDESTEKYSSTPVFDNYDEVLPLFCDKKEIARGTPAELKKGYEFIDESGKTKSKLKDNRIVYVLYKDEVFQLNLHGSSMYSFMQYAKTVLPPSVITRFNSESKEKGKICWNMITFSVSERLTSETIEEVIEKVKEIKDAIFAEKGKRPSDEIKTVKATVEDDGFESL